MKHGVLSLCNVTERFEQIPSLDCSGILFGMMRMLIPDFQVFCSFAISSPSARPLISLLFPILIFTATRQITQKTVSARLVLLKPTFSCFLSGKQADAKYQNQATRSNWNFALIAARRILNTKFYERYLNWKIRYHAFYHLISLGCWGALVKLVSQLPLNTFVLIAPSFKLERLFECYSIWQISRWYAKGQPKDVT